VEGGERHRVDDLVTSRLERIGAAARSEVVLKVIAFPLAFAGNLCRFEHTSPCAGEQ
jgi:hypothetical protein